MPLFLLLLVIPGVFIEDTSADAAGSTVESPAFALDADAVSASPRMTQIREMPNPDTTSPTDNTVNAEQFLAEERSVDSRGDFIPKSVTLRLTGYCICIILASMAGGWIPSAIQLTHTHMQTVISLVGGLMLGIAVFHLLPHSIHGGHSPDDTAWWMMAGIIAMFLLIRCFHFHHHGPLEISTAVEDPCAEHRHLTVNHDHDHDHGTCDHNVEPETVSGNPTASHIETGNTLGSSRALSQSSGIGHPHCHHAHTLSWAGITLGLSIHTLIDGMALAASVSADASHRSGLTFPGIGTFLAIMLHKPLDSMSITSLMAGAGWSGRSRFLISLGFSAMCPLGVILFQCGVRFFGDLQNEIVCAALAFSAGVFLCIALSDLLPEMEFHAHNRIRLTIALLTGILIAYGITFLEPAHLH